MCFCLLLGVGFFVGFSSPFFLGVGGGGWGFIVRPLSHMLTDYTRIARLNVGHGK